MAANLGGLTLSRALTEDIPLELGRTGGVGEASLTHPCVRGLENSLLDP